MPRMPNAASSPGAMPSPAGRGDGDQRLLPPGEGRDHPVKFPAKERFYADLAAWLRSSFDPDQNLVLVGDMNVAPLDLDIGIGADNAKRWLREGKCSFLPEERGWLQTLSDWGLYDAYREVCPRWTTASPGSTTEAGGSSGSRGAGCAST